MREEPPYNAAIEQLIEAARTVPGWRFSLSSLRTQCDPNGNRMTKMKFARRGGFLFPTQALKVDGVMSVHEWVERGEAHVTVIWRHTAQAEKS
jgi:hypothetical protein